MSGETGSAKPELRGVGNVQYRCALCGEMLSPEEAVIVDEKSYHPDHVPEMTDGE